MVIEMSGWSCALLLSLTWPLTLDSHTHSAKILDPQKFIQHLFAFYVRTSRPQVMTFYLEISLLLSLFNPRKRHNI